MTNQTERIEILLDCIGLEIDSFIDFLDWALSEHLVTLLSQVDKIAKKDFFAKKDSLRQFRSILRERTGRNWCINDLNLLYDAVKKRFENHFREPIDYGEYLRLLWNKPFECVQCGKKPPEVKLHIDHIIPVSLGGDSNASNLQFLCSACNLKKANKIEGGKPWLSLK